MDEQLRADVQALGLPEWIIHRIFLTPAEVAALFRVSEQALSDWRKEKGRTGGPPFVPKGRVVRYPTKLFVAWLRDRLKGAMPTGTVALVPSAKPVDVVWLHQVAEILERVVAAHSLRPPRLEQLLSESTKLCELAQLVAESEPRAVDPATAGGLRRRYRRLSRVRDRILRTSRPRRRESRALSVGVRVLAQKLNRLASNPEVKNILTLRALAGEQIQET